MLRAAIIAGALAGLVGCGLTPVEPGDDGVDPDAGVSDSDGPPATSALRFSFASDPRIPGDAGGREKATIASFEVELEDVRAISDNASPTLDELRLSWGEAYDAEHIVAAFDDAPPGIYSRLRAQIDSLSISGTVTVGGEVYDYIISGEPRTASVVVDLVGVALSGTSMTTVDIEVGVKDVIRGVSWTSLAPTATNGTIVLSAGEVDELARSLAEGFGQDD